MMIGATLVSMTIIKAARSAGGRLAAALLVGVVGMAPAAAQDWQVGGVAVVKPTYEGSDEYEVVGAPFVAPGFGAGQGRVSFNGLDDLRFRAWRASGFEFGVLGGYTFGRDEDDGDLLRGLGDVDGGLILGGYAGYRVGNLLLDASYHHIVTGDDTGYFLRFGGEVSYTPISRFKLKFRVGTTYADDNYMASYFGVTSAQSAASAANLAAFSTEADFKDVFIKSSATIKLSDRWTLLAGAGYKRLIGDAGDSPIVESEDQFTGTLGLTYKFNWSRR